MCVGNPCQKYFCPNSNPNHKEEEQSPYKVGPIPEGQLSLSSEWLGTYGYRINTS
jgi:hypothetical protein